MGLLELDPCRSKSIEIVIVSSKEGSFSSVNHRVILRVVLSSVEKYIEREMKTLFFLQKSPFCFCHALAFVGPPGWKTLSFPCVCGVQ